MRKFYQLIRIDMHSVMDEEEEKAMPVYMPVTPYKPELHLGYFTSKRKALAQLIDIQPKIMKNGIMIKPFYAGPSSRGYLEGWLVHDQNFGTIKCYMILEIKAK